MVGFCGKRRGGTQEPLEKLLKSQFSDPKMKINSEALLLASELASLFAEVRHSFSPPRSLFPSGAWALKLLAEAIQRALEQAKGSGEEEAQARNVEIALPQLFLDF
eukprot:CAMPEP_0174893490 /NCGR_PEP_ID=MMETSP0167-20121228/8315_1 /TAXON_ID=38298 /ORGANISM="Rhodella maculata, Strain CCMP736" /LENGTH=105 /DNA_ID=CAMNT_0016132305 /DNA_START=89 /DNA_END=407 /DNA_ORIENTATION=+